MSGTAVAQKLSQNQKSKKKSKSWEVKGLKSAQSYEIYSDFDFVEISKLNQIEICQNQILTYKLHSLTN